MDTILSLIIVPFKLPDWINPNDRRLMVNPHPFTKQYLMQNYNRFSWNVTCIHPIMAEVILKNKNELRSTVFSNPSPLLTELIVEKFEPTPENLHYLTTNINPKLAKFIISQKDNFDFKCWNNVMKNSNPELTEFIKEFHQIHNDRRFISSNTNPKLAELIMSISEFNDTLFINPNPGLTDFLSKLNPSLFSTNTNPDLAPLIIKLNGEKYKRAIYATSNIGLTDFIISNPPQNSQEWGLLITNRNPKLDRLVYDNRGKFEEYRHNLARNRYIFEPVKLKL